jgi:hypothetical protein
MTNIYIYIYIYKNKKWKRQNNPPPPQKIGNYARYVGRNTIRKVNEIKDMVFTALCYA